MGTSDPGLCYRQAHPNANNSSPPVDGGLELLSVRVGLAVARALDRLVPTPVRLKWPNDLMLNGRKLGVCERHDGRVKPWAGLQWE